MKNKEGTEFLLDGYISLGHPEPLIKDRIKYTIQRFQGDHKNEHILRAPNGLLFLYENNILKQEWKEDRKGIKSKEFIRYKNGRMDFQERFADLYEGKYFNRIVYGRKGLCMEILLKETGKLVYHGEYNGEYERDGWGIEYDEESGNVVVEGVWRKGTLIEIYRLFQGDVMTELKCNGADSLDPVKRLPIYVGGYHYDEEKEIFYREGKGYLINEKNGIAYREGDWKDGKELRGLDLKNGCYSIQQSSRFTDIPDLRETVTKSSGLHSLNIQVTDLVISSNCCNELNELDLSNYQCLRSLEIGDNCFQYVKTFKVDGLKRLKSVSIGKNSFRSGQQTILEINSDYSKSKSFHITNCDSLQWIKIGEFSFSDFSGAFELKKLKSLKWIYIGRLGSDSFNFYWSSLVIQGIVRGTAMNLKIFQIYKKSP